MELNRFELQTVVVFLLVVRTNLIKSLLSYYWQRCPWYTLVFLVMHSLQHLKQRLTLKCILLMLATESLICRCLCSFFFFLFCVYLLLSCWLSEKRDGCALVSRSERTGTATLPVWYTLYIGDAHPLLGKCEKKTIWWKEKKTKHVQ